LQDFQLEADIAELATNGSFVPHSVNSNIANFAVAANVRNDWLHRSGQYR
jgi:hypothetical protein